MRVCVCLPTYTLRTSAFTRHLVTLHGSSLQEATTDMYLMLGGSRGACQCRQLRNARRSRRGCLLGARRHGCFLLLGERLSARYFPASLLVSSRCALKLRC